MVLLSMCHSAVKVLQQSSWERTRVWRRVGLFLDSSDLLITGLNRTVYVLTEGETLIRTKARLLAVSGKRSRQPVWIFSVDPPGLILSHLVGQSAAGRLTGCSAVKMLQMFPVCL